MTTVRIFKMPFATNHFNANQKVFVLFMTGDLAALCVGRYRGRGRYVRVWVKWASKANQQTPPQIKEIEVADAFAIRLGLDWLTGTWT